jgi:basic membrane protein A
MHPGKVLTSMLKRVDVAVEKVLTEANNNQWKAGVTVLGLAEGGVDWAQDDNNKALITAEMRAAVEKASADIKAGTVKVHDYMSDQKCPVQ